MYKKTFIRRFGTVLSKIVHNPYLNMVAGSVIATVGLIEAYETLYEDITSLNARVPHALLLLGLLKALEGLSSFFTGINYINKGKEEIRK